jgi:hypothetical protein
VPPAPLSSCKRFANPNRRLDPRPKQRLICHVLADSQHPERNLRLIAEQRAADSATPRTNHLDDVTAAGVYIDDIRSINPRMAGANALLTSRGDYDSWTLSSWHGFLDLELVPCEP